MEQEIRVCIFGATGYTGVELLRILSRHPYAKVVSVTSQSYAGKRLSEVFPSLYPEPLGSMRLADEPEEDFDVAFLCLPHEVSLGLVPELLRRDKRVIDLSGAYRIRDASRYPEYYHFEHTHAELLQRAVYGLPEIFRGEVEKAQLVANPGCYPTATLLALYPLMKEGVCMEFVIVDALSGVSGAGRRTVQKFHYPEMEGDAFAYSVDMHRHTPEMEDVIERVYHRRLRVRFTPQVIPAVRGMLAKVYTRCEEMDFRSLYTEVYRGEPFVFLTDEPPHIKHVAGSNFCFLYLHYHRETSILEVISAIDNLGKGASSQAVQNFNVMMGFEEGLALKGYALFP